MQNNFINTLCKISLVLRRNVELALLKSAPYFLCERVSESDSKRLHFCICCEIS